MSTAALSGRLPRLAPVLFVAVVGVALCGAGARAQDKLAVGRGYASALPGTVQVSVSLDATPPVTALNFRLRFDPQILSTDALRITYESGRFAPGKAAEAQITVKPPDAADHLPAGTLLWTLGQPEGKDPVVLAGGKGPIMYVEFSVSETLGTGTTPLTLEAVEAWSTNLAKFPLTLEPGAAMAPLPRVVGYSTGDADGDGRLDQITVAFDKAVDVQDPDGGDGLAVFNVAGYTITPRDYSVTDTDTLVLQLQPGGAPDTAATPLVTFTNTGGVITDAVTGGPAVDRGATAATDEAGPAIVAARAVTTTSAEATLSEPIDDSTLAGPDFLFSDFATPAANGPGTTFGTGDAANDALVLIGLPARIGATEVGKIRFADVGVAQDTQAVPSTQTSLVVVHYVNDPPAAADDAFAVDEGAIFDSARDGLVSQAGAPSVLANDKDADGDPLAVEPLAVTPPLHGELLLRPDGSFTYAHDGSETQSDSFVYRVTDGAGGSDTATVAITVAPQNDPPTANDDAFSLDEGAALDSALTTNSLLANDTDPEGGILTVRTAPLTPPRHGSLVLRPDGTFTYQHDGGEAATDRFAYQISDPDGAVDAAEVIVTVAPINDPPVAVDDAFTIDEGATFDSTARAGLSLPSGASSVLVNDSDAEEDALTVETEPVTPPLHGDLDMHPNGTFTYTHDGTETFLDQFTYRVSDVHGDTAVAAVRITVVPRNDLPVAADDAFTVPEGATFDSTTAPLDTPIGAHSLLENDTDDDGDPLRVLPIPVAQPLYGKLTLRADGTFVYVHDGGESAADSFTYRVSDGNGGTDTAAVSITVDLENDPPQAFDDAFTVAEGAAFDSSLQPLDVLDGAHTVLANDVDAEGDGLLVLSPPLIPPEHGALALNPDGTFVYTHDGSETTSDSFVVEISDGNGGTDTAAVGVTIIPQNDPPVALDDAFTVTEGGTFDSPVAPLDLAPGKHSLLANDTDAEGDRLVVTVTPTLAPAHGTLSINPDGTFVYRHDGGESPTDTFTYEVSDRSGDKDTAVVDITVLPVNDPPEQIILAPLTLDEGGTALITGTELSSTDPDNTAAQLAYTIRQLPAHGTLLLDQAQQTQGRPFTQADVDAGRVSYTHDGSETLEDSFLFSLSDGAGGTLGATRFDVHVTPLNDQPVVAINAGLILDEGDTAGISGSLLRADDPDTSPGALTFTLTSAPQNGTMTRAGSPLAVTATWTQADLNSGLLTYRHDGGETAADEFRFSLSDGAGGLVPDTAFAIGVNPRNAPPVAVDDALTVPEAAVFDSTAAALDTPAGEHTLLGNDRDEDLPGDLLTVNTTPVEPPAHGDLALAPDGTFVYTHDGSETTADSFVYEISDGTRATATATAHITITPQNDTPAFPQTTYAFGVAETAAQGTAIGVVRAADPDVPLQALAYTITAGNDEQHFTLDPVTGKLTVAAPLDIETTGAYSLTVTVTDDGPGELSGQTTVNITVVDANEPPAFDPGPYTFQVAEDAIPGTPVGPAPLHATDPDLPPQALAYSILSGNTGDAFGIDPDAGRVLVARTLDAETVPVFELTVAVRDDGPGALIDTILVTIEVTDVNEPPLFVSDPFRFQVAEGAPGGTTVGAVQATDEDLPEQDLTYTITTGNGAGVFVIDPVTGQITTTAPLDFEATPTVALTVEATDNGVPPLAGTAAVEITVTDVNEPPEFDRDAYVFPVPENTPVGASVGSVSATDPDRPAQPLAYSISAGNGAGRFTINGGTGEITLAAALDFEAEDEYTLTLVVTDNGLPPGTDTATATVQVGDVDEIPPHPTIDAPDQPDPTNAAPILFTVAFDEDVTGFNDDDIQLEGSAGATTANVSPSAGRAQAYTVAVTGMTQHGTVTIDVAPGAAADAAGNASTAPTTVKDTVTYDPVAPGLTAVSILSDNAANTAYARPDDTVALLFRPNEPLRDAPPPNVTIGAATAPPVFDAQTGTWRAARAMAQGETPGPIPFTIEYADVAGNPGPLVTQTTDGSTVTFDDAVPHVTRYVTRDADANGRIDRLVVWWDRVVDVADTADDAFPDVTVAGYQITQRDYTARAVQSLTLVLQENAQPDTDATPTVTFTSVTPSVTDRLTGVPAAPEGQTPAEDGSGPAIVGAATLTTTSIEVTLSESIDDATAAGADFLLSGFATPAANGPAVDVASGVPNDETIIVYLGAEIAPAETGRARFQAPGVLADASAEANTQTAPVGVTRGIGPVPQVVGYEVRDATANGQLDELVIRFDLPVNVVDDPLDGFAPVAVTGFAVVPGDYSAAGVVELSLLLQENGVPDTGAPPSVVFANDGSVRDAGTSAWAADRGPTDAADKAGPAIWRAATVTTTTVELVLSEAAGDGSTAPEDFVLSGFVTDGANGPAVGLTPGGRDDDVFVLTLAAPIGPDEVGQVRFAGLAVVIDATGNASTQTTAVDVDDGMAPPPEILTYGVSDANANGQVDTLTVVFSGPVDVSDGNAADGLPELRVAGYAIEAGSYSATAATTLVLPLLESGAPDTNARPKVTFANPDLRVTDATSGAAVPDLASTRALDEAGPAIVQAKALTTTAIEAVLSEPVDDDTIAGADFTFTGFATANVNGPAVAVDTGATPNDNTVVLWLAEALQPAADVNGSLAFSAPGVVSDLAAASPPSQTNENTQATPVPVGVALSARPTLVRAETQDVSGGQGDGWLDRVVLVFDRPVDVLDANGAADGFPSVSVDGYQIVEDDYQIANTTRLPLRVRKTTRDADGDTDATPAVTFVNDGSVQALDGVWAADAGPFAAVDRAGPAILSAQAVTVTTVQLAFSEPVRDRSVKSDAVTGDPLAFLFAGFADGGANGQAESVATGVAADDDVLLVTLAGTLIPGETGGTVRLDAPDALRDVVGNPSTQVVDVLVHDAIGQLPAITGYSTGDSDADGRLDQIVAAFDRPIDVAGGSVSQAFTVEGYTIAPADYARSAVTSLTLRLQPGASPDSGQTPPVAFANNGSVTDAVSGAPAVNREATVPLDGAPPIVTSVSSNSPDAWYRPGAGISIFATFSEAVIVTNGTLLARLDTGGSVLLDTVQLAQDRAAPYSLVSGTHVVRAGEYSADLDVVALQRSSASVRVKDAAGNAAPLTVPAANGLADNRDLRLPVQLTIAFDPVGAPLPAFTSTLTPPPDHLEDGQAFYLPKTRVVASINAPPPSDVRSRITGWSLQRSTPLYGAGSMTPPFTLAADAVLTWFWRTEWKLTVDVRGKGTVSRTPAGEPATDRAATSAWYADGQLVSLKAQPATGQRFSGWFENGARVSADLNWQLTVGRARTVVATFDLGGSFRRYIVVDSPAPVDPAVMAYFGITETRDAAPIVPQPDELRAYFRQTETGGETYRYHLQPPTGIMRWWMAVRVPAAGPNASLRWGSDVQNVNDSIDNPDGAWPDTQPFNIQEVTATGVLLGQPVNMRQVAAWPQSLGPGLHTFRIESGPLFELVLRNVDAVTGQALDQTIGAPQGAGSYAANPDTGTAHASWSVTSPWPAADPPRTQPRYSTYTKGGSVTLNGADPPVDVPWRLQWFLDFTTRLDSSFGDGSINAVPGWYNAPGTLPVSATAGPHTHFVAWETNVPTAQDLGFADISVPVPGSRPAALAPDETMAWNAVFAADEHLLEVASPYAEPILTADTGLVMTGAGVFPLEYQTPVVGRVPASQIYQSTGVPGGRMALRGWTWEGAANTVSGTVNLALGTAAAPTFGLQTPAGLLDRARLRAREGAFTYAGPATQLTFRPGRQGRTVAINGTDPVLLDPDVLYALRSPSMTVELRNAQPDNPQGHWWIKVNATASTLAPVPPGVQARRAVLARGTGSTTSLLSVVQDSFLTWDWAGQSRLSLVTTGDGAVQRIPAGTPDPIQPGAHWYAADSVVTLLARPAVGYSVQWNGVPAAEQNRNALRVTMDEARTVSVRFIAIQEPEEELGPGQRVLSVRTSGEGTVERLDSAQRTSPSGTYTFGTKVRLLPTALDGHRFNRWYGDLASSGYAPNPWAEELVLLLDQADGETRTVVADFVPTGELAGVHTTAPAQGSGGVEVYEGLEVTIDHVPTALVDVGVTDADLQPGGPQYPFLMGQHQVTVGEYVTFLNDLLTAPDFGGQAPVYVDPATGSVYFSPARAPETLMFEPDQANSSDYFDYGIAYRLADPERPYTFHGDDHVLPRQDGPDVAEHPIVGVTLYGAMKYCNWLSRRKGLGWAHWCYAEGDTPEQWRPAHLEVEEWLDGFDPSERQNWLDRYPDAFRLPMDDYAEVASPFNEVFKAAAWDGSSQGNRLEGTGGPANMWDDAADTHGPQSFTASIPNYYGLDHALGNVWEWVTDHWLNVDGTPASRQFGIRGWSWWNSFGIVDASFRWHVPAHGAYSDLGFRVVTGTDYQFDVELADEETFSARAVVDRSGLQTGRIWYPELLPAWQYYWRVQASYPSGLLPSALAWYGSMSPTYDPGIDTRVYPGPDTEAWAPVQGTVGMNPDVRYDDPDRDGKWSRVLGENIWADRGDAGYYDDGIDVRVFDGGDDQWDTADGAEGRAGFVLYNDADGDGLHDPPEDVWRDNGAAGRYDAGVDVLVYDGGNGGQPFDGMPGSQAGVFYFNDPAYGPTAPNATYDAGEDLWRDDATGRPGVYDQGIDARIYDGGDGWTAPHGAQGTRSGVYYSDVNVDGYYATTGYYDVDTDTQVHRGKDGWTTASGRHGSDLGLFFHDSNGNGTHDAGEEIWLDEAAGNSAAYDRGVDTRIYDGGDGWQTPHLTGGTKGGLYYNDATNVVGKEFGRARFFDPDIDSQVHAGNDGEWKTDAVPEGRDADLLYADTDGNGEYSPGEEIWLDTGNAPGIYDGADQQVSDGGDGVWQTTAPAAGINDGIFFADLDGNGRYSAAEDIWQDVPVVWNRDVWKDTGHGEDIWLDAGRTGAYDPDIDEQVSSGTDGWRTPAATNGRSEGLLCADTDRNSRYSPGEEIWQDRGRPGVYDAGVDAQVFPPPGEPGWVVLPDTPGSLTGLYYADADGDGRFTVENDNLWKDNDDSDGPSDVFEDTDEPVFSTWRPVAGMPGENDGLYYDDVDGDHELTPGRDGLWKDSDGRGTVGVYDPADDHLILGPAPVAGTRGVSVGLFYSDANRNGEYDDTAEITEDIWTKARYATFSTKPEGLQQVVLTVGAGWNLVSVPIYPVALDIPFTVAPNNLTLWGWDTLRQQYAKTQMMEPRRAYWLFALAAGEIVVTGYAIEDPRVFVHGPGWDLIGVIEPINNLRLIQLPVRNAPGVVTDLFVPIYWWSVPGVHGPADGQAVYIPEDETRAVELRRFLGYWIKAKPPPGTQGGFEVELIEFDWGL